MELEQLRIFLAVAEEASFSEAARKLVVSHSTTSRAVSALERELETPLFLRLGRSVTLTPAGEVLKAKAADLLDLAEKVKEAVHAAEEGETTP